MKRLLTLALFAVALTACTNKDEVPGLKTFIKDDFKIGVAVGPGTIEGIQGEMVKKHFNSMTAENAMKPASIIRPDGSYDFSQADKIVAFAQENGMKMRGHTLVWHGSTPRGYMNDAEGKPLTKEQIMEKHENYIKAVFEHYPKDVIYAWDVVNEALADVEGESIYRTRSPWYNAFGGPEFIEWAFRTAKKYAPEGCELIYNDYNLVDPAKLERACTMLKEMLDKGVPIDGVGMQAHWDNTVSEEQIQTAIDRFSALGLDVQITELDLTCFDNYHGPGAQERQKIKQSVQYTSEMADAQAEEYAMIFRTLHKNRDKISAVTFWCLSDRSSWLNNFVRGRLDYPLLFDAQYQPKKCYYAVKDVYTKK